MASSLDLTWGVGLIIAALISRIGFPLKGSIRVTIRDL